MNTPELCRFGARVALVVCCIVGVGAGKPKSEKNEKELTGATIFQTTNVWTVHLHLTRESWKAMQPPLVRPSSPNPHGGASLWATEEPKYVPADLEMGTSRFKNVAVRLKGSPSFEKTKTGNLYKHSFKVDLNEFVKGQKLGSQTKLNFHNNLADPSWMNESLSYQLYRDAGVPAPKTAYAKVYVTVPGEHEHTYMGLYSMVEDVDRPFATENFGSKKGAIFKPEIPKPETTTLFAYLGEDWAKYRPIYDPKTEITQEQAQRLIDFCKLVSKADDQEFENKITSFLDLEEFSKFLAVTVYLSTLDSLLGMGQNFYLHLSPGSQQFQFIPWDQDRSFGQFQLLGTQEQREQLSILKPWVGENRFLERLFKLPTFQTTYQAQLRAFQESLFQPERFQRQVDSVAAAIRSAVQEEATEKLIQLERAIAGEIVVADAIGPRHGGAAGRYLKPIKTFVKLRSASLSEQLSGRSKGQKIERPGGEEPH